MGDIARHRDIYLNTRDAVPLDLLSRCHLSRDDLTYLELGNYFTDVSQFRDPVFYLYAKQTVWREEVLPAAADNAGLTAAKALAHLALLAGAAAALAFGEGKTKALAIPAVLGSPLLKAADSEINDLLADFIGVDEWLDGMLGKPIEKLDPQGKRKPGDYGYVGRFFQHFIEGVTHMLFAQDVPSGPKGDWSRVTRISPAGVTAVFDHSFTQYFPHEHTDQPPYVWDASKRPGKPMYEPGPRRLGRPRGIMNVVYEHYINYLAERLSTLENEWRAIGQNDQDKRRMWLVDVGKVLHGIEDWFFHSNVVELIRLHSHKPDEVPDADREAFVKRIIRAELNREPEYGAAGANRKRLERFFYRRLRFPVYGSGTRESTGGVASTRESILNWDHAYPAFPSTLDTAHTLVGALEGLEAKLHPGGGNLATLDMSELFRGAEWLDCVIKKFHAAGPEWSRVYHEKATARNVTLDKDGMPVPKTAGDIPRIQAWAIDVLRELVPLVLTLLHERERQRLVVDVAPMDMPLDGSAPKPRPGVTPGKGQVQAQLARHVNALKPKKDAQGVEEHNYARAARYLKECGSLNSAGETAIAKAFDVDIESEKKKVNADTPGAGGFLIKFAVKLQTAIDKAKAGTIARDRDDPYSSIATDNGSDNEIIGSHSLMSKDTKESSPFFDDARVLGAVASLSTFQIMLEEVSAPGQDRLNWQKILRYFIRFPPSSGGWERQALAQFAGGGRGATPTFADLPDFGELKKARIPLSEAERWWTGERTKKLQQMYVDLEKALTQYRYP
jgi:hypothetical protein